MNKLYGYQFSAILMCFCLSNIFILNLQGAQAHVYALALLPGIALVSLLCLFFKRPLDYTLYRAYGRVSPVICTLFCLYFLVMGTLSLSYYAADTVMRQLEQVPVILLVLFVAACATYAAGKQSEDMGRSATIIVVVAGLCFLLATVLELTSGITQNLFTYENDGSLAQYLPMIAGVQFVEISAALVFLPFLDAPKKKLLLRTIVTTAVGGVLVCAFAYGAQALEYTGAVGFTEQSSSYAGTITVVKLLIVGTLFFFVVLRLSVIIFAASRCISFVTKKSPKAMAAVCGSVCAAGGVALSLFPDLPSQIYTGFYTPFVFAPFLLLIIASALLFRFRTNRNSQEN